MKMRLNGATEGQYDVVRPQTDPFTTPNTAVPADPRPRSSSHETNNLETKAPSDPPCPPSSSASVLLQPRGRQVPIARRGRQVLRPQAHRRAPRREQGRQAGIQSLRHILRQGQAVEAARAQDRAVRPGARRHTPRGRREDGAGRR